MAKAVRLDKFLADAGKGTRSEVKKIIQKGQVQVNGAPAKKPELKVDPEKDTVILSGETVGVAPEFVYYLLNKPAGCVSATEDRNDRTVMEYVPSDRKGIFPVGRLDKDTEGLLLITDDGIKQVFSIWICMNMDYNSLSHIHLAKDEMLSPYDWKGNMDLLNIVLVGITNDIPEHDENYEMHRLIGALLSTELREQEKLDIIEHEYNIPISNELREDVRIMCNLSTGIEEKATEKTSEKFILNMYKKGYTLDQIADIAETSVAAVEAVIKKKEPAMA